ncbi:MAG: glycosyltransferase family 2 protein [Oscillatoria sp. PMC 1051.18]|nr:glycosyltransferase family 2 protein [Oscillatoria sp. PMC 1050.18]MEC5029938.1 glycosyltransferase family 2 protein [Oscillatoria sp. PMC 1051.18]
MKFSIVITTYNRLSLLKRAIATALAQTIPCEVIVVDDGSSDETKSTIISWCEQLKAQGNQHLIYHCNSENLGHSKSVNRGVELASGDWVKLLDDDDYLAPNCIEEMIRAIALRPQAVICSVQAAQVDDRETVLSVTRRVGPGKAFYIPQEDIHYGMLLEQVPFGTPVQVAFRRDAFLKTGGWDSTLDANFDDIDSWIKIAQFGDAIFINKCLAYRTIWAGALNQKFTLRTRLNTNILIKEKIHALVNSKYRERIPSKENISKYMKLHWSLVALKKGNLVSALQFSFPASLSLVAWKLLLERALADESLTSQNISAQNQEKKIGYALKI